MKSKHHEVYHHVTFSILLLLPPPVKSKYSPQHYVLELPQLMLFPYKTTEEIIVFQVLIFTFLDRNAKDFKLNGSKNSQNLIRS